MEKIKYSIIMPIYNVEDYLHQAIESVLTQSYKNFELILVDDGSSDSCPLICDEYVKKDDRIKVIHKENGGLSDARNVGIKLATGDYLMFIDSDDFLINDQALSKLNEIASKCEYDVIQYKSISYYPKSNNKFVYSSEFDIDNDLDLQAKLFELVKMSKLSISACDKIVKNKIIKCNNIYFTKNLISEDIDWSIMLYQHIDTLYVSNLDLYVYRKQRANSITSKASDKTIDSTVYILNKWMEYSFKNEKQKEIFMNYLAYTYSILMTNVNKNNASEEKRKEIYKMSDILNYQENYKVKMINKLKKVIGLRLTIVALKVYMKLHKTGLISI